MIENEMYSIILQSIKDDLASSDKTKQHARDFNEFLRDLVPLLFEESVSWQDIERKGVQSIQFMIHMLPRIHQYFSEFPRGRSFKVLEVGPGSGHGSQLLMSLYGSKRLGYAIKLTTLDINAKYKKYFQFMRCDIEFKEENLFNLKEKFDLVIASHVLEHVKDPSSFVEKMKQVCLGKVIIQAPWEEDYKKLTAGHINVFDQSFIDKTSPSYCDYLESPAWGYFLEPKYKVFIAEYRGQA